MMDVISINAIMDIYTFQESVHETVGHDQVAHEIGCLCISL